MTMAKALTVVELRAFLRKNASILGVLTDTVTCGYDHPYDDAVAAAARRIVDYPPMVWDVVSFGTQKSIAEIQNIDWRQVVISYAEIVELSRDVFRKSWENGFLKKVVYGELRDFSSHVRQIAI